MMDRGPWWFGEERFSTTSRDNREAIRADCESDTERETHRGELFFFCEPSYAKVGFIEVIYRKFSSIFRKYTGSKIGTCRWCGQFQFAVH